MKKQTGFSLVELVVVIVVIGLLSVAALPKFLDITEDAEEAVFVAHVSSFQSGLLMVRSQHELDNNPEEIEIGDETLNFVNVDGEITDYPNVLNASDCSRMWNIVLDGTRSTHQVDILEENMMFASYEEEACSFEYNDYGTISYVSGDGDIDSTMADDS